ncbi:hypothetical protein [Nonomuraea jabiensis]|uniref:Uncharacterized protein n=1 Tax=Nonomuraea jabiensis TaxID=882448 RepID=A0A7W9G2I4_9ACTN|nr:hypothetical protein [Nonomuraea jabiensis]MBB5775981.1 hypothetical protein [Nonomuraea jabiensis]
MLHSPACTRDFATSLVGRSGRVTGLLRNGTYAMVELDGEPGELPGGIRRWPVHWDDLELSQPAPRPESADAYRLGLSGSGRDAVHHAVPQGRETGLCGQRAYPLPVMGWSLSFSATATRACPACIH